MSNGSHKLRTLPRVVRRLGFSSAWIVAVLMAATRAAEAEPPPVTFELEDETGVISELEVGRSLFLRAGELSDRLDIVVTLVDENETDVLLAARLDASGRHEAILLWGATGIVGCDCGSKVGSHAYARFEHALEELVGRSLLVELRHASGEVVAEQSVDLVEPLRPIAYTADASGCPRFTFGDSEDLYVFVRGGELGEEVWSRLFLDGTTLPKDVRGETWQDEVFALTPPETRLLLWRAEDSFHGDLVPSIISSGWPFNVSVLLEDGINSGVVVQDHSCPLPPP